METFKEYLDSQSPENLAKILPCERMPMADIYLIQMEKHHPG